MTDANHDSVLTPSEWRQFVSLLGVSKRQRRREVSIEFGTAGARHNSIDLNHIGRNYVGHNNAGHNCIFHDYNARPRSSSARAERAMFLRTIAI